jgi:hypothetical protein
VTSSSDAGIVVPAQGGAIQCSERGTGPWTLLGLAGPRPRFAEAPGKQVDHIITDIQEQKP